MNLVYSQLFINLFETSTTSTNQFHLFVVAVVLEAYRRAVKVKQLVVTFLHHLVRPMKHDEKAVQRRQYVLFDAHFLITKMLALVNRGIG